MNNDGFFRAAACVPRVAVADVDANVQAIKSAVRLAEARGAQLAVLPEMCVTGYTCADLFHNFTLLDAAERAVRDLVEWSAGCGSAFVVGAPLRVGPALYNCAFAICAGRLLAIVPKTYVPNYNEFYEKRWWQPAPPEDKPFDVEVGGLTAPFGTRQLVRIDGVSVGIEICEDLWTPLPPSSLAAMAGAQVLANLSASDDLIGKYTYLLSLVSQQSARCIAGYVYASAGYGESSTDLVFDGKGLIAENGTLLAQAERWQGGEQVVVADIDIAAIDHDRMRTGSFADCAARNGAARWPVIETTTSVARPDTKIERVIRPLPFVPADDAMGRRCSEIINIQAAGLARRIEHIRCRATVVGISGGLDSTLALLVAAKAYDRLGWDRKGIVGITMPGFGTTGRTKGNAVRLMEELGVTMMEIPIGPAVEQHFKDIGQDPAVHDVTYENSQARERTQILMDVANKMGGMVLGTGDLSELALGWATYNGDHISMYGVNAGVPKTLVKYLVRHFADEQAYAACRDTLLDIIDTPISPELIPADEQGNITQKTEDLVGPYELHDFFLYYTLRYGFSPCRIYRMARQAFAGAYSDEVMLKWLRTFCRRFFQQQFKRSCLPDGPKVGSVCLSPRGDWRMPSDADASLWLAEIETLK